MPAANPNLFLFRQGGIKGFGTHRTVSHRTAPRFYRMTPGYLSGMGQTGKEVGMRYRLHTEHMYALYDCMYVCLYDIVCVMTLYV